MISTGQRATFGSAYTLDGVGNRIQTDLNEPMMPAYNAETINYTYYPVNILYTAGGSAYAYDANGNRIQKTAGAGTTMYAYDSLNRLVQVVKGAQTTQYIYNGLGQRVGRIDNDVQTNYLIDPNGILPQVLAETDASNNLIAFYVYDGAGLVAKISSSNEYYFYHYDGLGSTIAISNSNGAVVNEYCYSPEGLVGAQETIPNPFQYVGRFGVMAEGNGLYYMGVRYYDPEVGRFINKDPIGYFGGLNLFTYVGNNPANFIDPNGEFAFMPVIVVILKGAAIMKTIDWAVSGYYDYQIYKELDDYEKWLRKELSETSSCEIERFDLLQKGIEKVTLRKAQLAEKWGINVVTRFPKRPIPKGSFQ